MIFTSKNSVNDVFCAKSPCIFMQMDTSDVKHVTMITSMTHLHQNLYQNTPNLRIKSKNTSTFHTITTNQYKITCTMYAIQQITVNLHILLQQCKQNSTTQNFLLHCVVNCYNANNFYKNNMLFILV